MILHVNTSREWRGGEQQLYYLSSGLKSAEIPQLVVGIPNSPLEERCQQDGIPFYGLEMRGEWDFKAAKQIRNLCKSQEAKLIHAHTGHAHTLSLLAKRNHLKIPLIVSRRVDFKPATNFFSRWKYKHKAIDYFLPVSMKIRSIMAEAGISPEKLITVYSGIDTKRFHKLPSADALREEFGISKKTSVIGNIAALVDHKDQETLIRAISLVKTDIPFKVIIVGEGKLEKRLKSLSSELGLNEKVIFTGYRTEIPEFLSLFDIFTLTSKEEGLGTSVLDAMASGLPVVATRGGGIAEMLTEGKGALLSDVGDVEHLAKSYESLLQSESLRDEFGAFNKNSVKRFTYQNTVEKTKLIYFSLLGNTIHGLGQK
ncbi:glycosyltransferase [Leptospira ryugenii]|uniref:Glycosyltransferase n=1 Tax=Leptospira ryugenii TaxID=1917863 RepID=A0A2P2DZH8_9LEPT|nr:glycosyltransferase [Leptospira ryugenii]GBF50038.1 glycosyltransferase [Leptospira ryugenii]